MSHYSCVYWNSPAFLFSFFVSFAAGLSSGNLLFVFFDWFRNVSSFARCNDVGGNRKSCLLIELVFVLLYITSFKNPFLKKKCNDRTWAELNEVPGSVPNIGPLGMQGSCVPVCFVPCIQTMVSNCYMEKVHFPTQNSKGAGYAWRSVGFLQLGAEFSVTRMQSWIGVLVLLLMQDFYPSVVLYRYISLQSQRTCI